MTLKGPSLLAPLRNRIYRHPFAAQVVTLIGTGLATVALALLAFNWRLPALQFDEILQIDSGFPLALIFGASILSKEA